MRLSILASLAMILCGCSGILSPPVTPGEFVSGYSYVPLDPLPVKVVSGPNCGPGHPRGPLLDALPDNAVRVAIRKLSGTGSLGFGPAQLGYEGSSYRVILDYINVDVANIRFAYTGQSPIEGNEPATLVRLDQNAPAVSRIDQGQGEIIIPVYVGLGLRLTADITVHKGSVNLSSLGALSAAAAAERVSGSLTVQTLGVTGPKVTTALPLPNKLDQTTIEAAILSIGTIKALVPDQTTIRTARVTGIYNPIRNADQDTIHRIVSQLAGDKPVEWKQDCP